MGNQTENNDGTQFSATANLAIAGLASGTLYLLVLKAIDTGSWLTYVLTAVCFGIAVRHIVWGVRGIRRHT